MISQSAKLQLTRRELFRTGAMGIGVPAWMSLLSEETIGAKKSYVNPLRARESDYKRRAKSVIYIHMIGAPSQLDLYVDKPKLREMTGELCPDELFNSQQFAFIRSRPKMYGSAFKFRNYGESGQTFSELLPNIGSMADDIAVIKSMYSEQINHAPAQLFMQTGFGRFGRPSMGSWVTYGLGSENENLPAFVVMVTGSVGGAGNSMWGSGFLPSIYQGVEFRASGDPVLFLSNPKGVHRTDRRKIVDAIVALNREQLVDMGDPEIATRIGQYEMAFRMQTSVPKLMDTSQESMATHEMYGTKPGQASFANNCMLARRFVERGVRFVQLFDQGWDHHGGIEKSIRNKASQIDKPIAALLKDLKQRGLLDETLVICGSEFGRTPMVQGNLSNAGRDHHKDCFAIWMAGGGIRGGSRIGESDDLGFSITADPVSVHDFHATVLHLLGKDHEELTYRYQGRQFRLTDVAGTPVQKILS